MAYLLPSSVSPEALLQGLLAVSLTAVSLLRPLYEASGELADFALDYLNPAAQRMTGLPAQPSGTVRTRFPHLYTNGVFAIYQHVFETGEAGHVEFNYQADGFDNYFQVAARRSGELLVVSFTDTANQDRSAVELALRESQAAEHAARAEAEAQRRRFYEVLMALPAQVATYQGPDHVYHFVNAAYQRYFPVQALPGRSLREVLPETEGQGVLAVMDRVYQTGEPHYFQELEVWLDFTGEGQRPQQLFLNLYFHPLRDAQGRVDGLLDFSYDVTEQVLARRQLAQLNQELEARVAARTKEAQTDRRLAEMQQQRLEQLFLHAPAAICILSGPGLVYELVNPTYQQLFPGRALMDLPLLEALPELTDQPVWHSLQQVYRTGTTHLELGIHIPVARHADGPLEDFYFNYIQQARFDAAGQVDGVLVFAFDVTEQVQARQQVQALNEALAASNAALQQTNDTLHETNRQLTRTNVDLDTFVYTASHDLKAPITNIEGLLDVLREYLPPAEQAPVVPQLVERMQAAIVRFQQTVGHLTDIAYLQHQPAQPQETIDLARVLDDVRQDLLPLLESTQAQLRLDVAACPPLRFSPKDLRSILYNLLSNALKYRAPERRPVVQVRARYAAGQVVVEVQDNGLGLSESQQGKLFTMFKRLHTHVEGSGVGLYLIKRLIENAGGTITVQSQLGEGSTFTVTLPQA